MLRYPTERKDNVRTLQPRHSTCTYSDWARPSMSKRSPWSSLIGDGTSSGARRRTWNSTEQLQIILTLSLGEFCGPNKGSLSQCQGMCDSKPAHRFRFIPVGTSPFAHHGDKRGATLHHKPSAPSQMASSVCGLTAAPRPYSCGHRQSCPGVTRAVSNDPRFLHSTRRWRRLEGSIRALESPFSTQNPDPAVPHTFLQPIDCLMPSPRRGDTKWESATSGWINGLTAPLLDHLVPGRRPGECTTICLRAWPAGRKFQIFGRTGNATFGTLLSVEPWLQQATELRASRKGETVACATTAADKGASERQVRDGAAHARAAKAERAHACVATHTDEIDDFMNLGE